MQKTIEINPAGLDYAWNECQKLGGGIDRATLDAKLSAKTDWYDPAHEDNIWSSGLKNSKGRPHKITFAEDHFFMDINFEVGLLKGKLAW